MGVLAGVQQHLAGSCRFGGRERRNEVFMLVLLRVGSVEVRIGIRYWISRSNESCRLFFGCEALCQS